MPKTPTDMILSGPTMGTVWQVVLDQPDRATDLDALRADLQTAVDEVDGQMSTWKPDSDLMRFNRAPVGEWIALPIALLIVLEAGLALSLLTEGAFEMNLGDAVRAWGFGGGQIELAAIRAASAAPRIRATDALRIDRAAGRAWKEAPLSLDLSGIAKGYGVDRLAGVVEAHGLHHALCSIDGEVRALGPRADGSDWAVGLDAPDSPLRGSHSVLTLSDRSVATSGDYRHFVTVRDTRLSHTIHPATRAPVVEPPASVTVLGPSCMLADAMATALMVLGPDPGIALARAQGIDALILTRDGRTIGTGPFARA